MGKLIEKLATQKGHELVCILDQNSSESDWQKLENAQVAIEFTQPEAAIQNIYRCFKHNIPVVVGTTGWYEHLSDVTLRCQQEQQTLFTATNFSIGVNLFFHINKLMSNAISSFPDYNIAIEEIHHTEKKDAPSGTAITTAERIIESHNSKNSWALNTNQPIQPNEIGITAKREENVPGTHTVFYNSPIDTIEIKHTAHSREGFALGAITAAEWLIGKKGIYTMKDILGF